MKQIAFVTDIHLMEDGALMLGADPVKNWKVIINDLKERNIDMLVFGGDIGSSAAHEMFFDSLKPWKDRLYVVPGNHDKFSDLVKYSKWLTEGNDELYYSFDDSYRFIFLDTSRSFYSDAQYNWLSEKLKTDLPVIIFIHHPVFEVNSIVDKMYPLEGREKLKSLLSSVPIDITIFCGHLHTSDKSINGNVTQYVTLASSYQAEKDPVNVIHNTSIFGYRLIEANGNISTKEILFNT